MSGENVSSVGDAAKARRGESGGARERSTIGFPYGDLDSVVSLAQAIHNNVGTGECSDDQLAAWTNKSHKSSGFRTDIYAARMFGVMESPNSGQHRLTLLGRQIVDRSQSRAARAQAFLNVPLYRALYEKYRGTSLPAVAALEREINTLGVADKMKDRARRTFERSAEQAGFFEHGRDRLVEPGITQRDAAEAEERARLEREREARERENAGGGGGYTPKGLHPFIQGLLGALPDSTLAANEHPEWPVNDRIKWLQTAANIFDLIYKGDGGIDVRPAPALRSPRPE